MDFSVLIASVCLSVVALETVWLIYRHKREWRSPHLQKLYVRIILLPLVFSLVAFISLFHPGWYSMFDSLRHVYEGYALFCFASLMMLCAGGDDAVEAEFDRVSNDSSRRLVYGNPFRLPCFECYHFKHPAQTLHLHRVGIMQYMITGPAGEMFEFIYRARSGEAVSHDLSVFINLTRIASILITMRCMLGLYTLLKPSIKELRAVSKFAVIKVVVFVAVVQGVILAYLLRGGWLEVPGNQFYSHEGLPQTEINECFMSQLLLLEMTIIACCFGLAYDVTALPPCDAQTPGDSEPCTWLEMLCEVGSFTDICGTRLVAPTRALLHEKQQLVGHDTHGYPGMRRASDTDEVLHYSQEEGVKDDLES